MPQLAALALAAGRIPLAAHWPRPPQTPAVHEMLIVQFAASALLFPFLLRDRWSALAVILIAGPMLRLAAYLAPTPLPLVLRLWMCVGVWLAGLAMWRSALPAGRHLPAVAIASLATLGGPLMVYLSTEFGSAPTSWADLLPLSASLGLLDGHTPFRLPLLSTAMVAIAGAPAALASLRMRNPLT